MAGFAGAALLAGVGGLLLWGSAYVHNTVQNQLAAQRIYFPPASAFAHLKAGTEITPAMIPSVSQYAGEQLLTGQQAEAYADHFIAQHIAEIGGGKTYSQLNVYGWWKVSQVTYIASLIAFGLAGLLFLASLAGLTLSGDRSPVSPPLGPWPGRHRAINAG